MILGAAAHNGVGCRLSPGETVVFYWGLAVPWLFTTNFLSGGSAHGALEGNRFESEPVCERHPCRGRSIHRNRIARQDPGASPEPAPAVDSTRRATPRAATTESVIAAELAIEGKIVGGGDVRIRPAASKAMSRSMAISALTGRQAGRPRCAPAWSWSAANSRAISMRPSSSMCSPRVSSSAM